MPLTYRTIGLFGGTFDPIHLGHLRMALELKTQLQLDEMRLVPAHIPPHRHAPKASAEHRLAMVKAALAGCEELSVDEVELANPEPSYSIHTLAAVREREGKNVALCLAMGMDSLLTLPSWRDWQSLLTLAHIVVAARPGWFMPDAGEIVDYVQQHRTEAAALKQSPCGALVIAELRLLPISATDIRQQLSQGHSPQFLVPDGVYTYINQHQLYR